MANFYVGPQLQSAPTFGATFGAGLGQGLSSGIQALANLKMQQLSQRSQAAKTAQGLQALGYSPEQASAYSQLPTDLLKPIVQQDIKTKFSGATSMGPWPHLVPGQTPEFYQAINAATPGVQQQFFKSYLDSLGHGVPTAEEISATIQPGIGSPTLSQTLNELAPQEAQAAEATPTQAPPEHLMNLMQNLGGPLQLPTQQLEAQPPQPQAQIQPQQVAPQPTVPIVKPKKQTVAEQIAAGKTAKAAKAEQVREQARIDKETKSYYDDVLTKGEAADFADKRLGRIQKLISESVAEKKPLAHPLRAAFTKVISKIPFLGIDISGVLNTNSAEFQKLSNDFIREAKAIFGARMTDADLNAFLQMIPTLLQSDEGKTRIMNNMYAANDAAKVKAEAMKSIIKENGGRRPDNLRILVEERAKPALDELARKMKLGYGREYQLTPDSDVKLPQAQKFVVGSILSTQGQKFINRGDRWEVLPKEGTRS